MCDTQRVTRQVALAVIEFELAPEAVCIMCVDLCKNKFTS